MSEPATLLVADDDPGLRESLERTLTREGYRVLLASDGRAALERVQGGGIDLIVTDLKMPGLSGIELHDRIAAVSPENVAKLVMITGDTASPDAAEFFGRLRQPLIQKPFDMRALADLLDRIAPAGAVPVPPAP